MLRIVWIGLILGMMLSLVACQGFGGLLVTDESTPEAPESTPDTQNLPPDVLVQGQQVRQWAVEAEASSEFASPEWGATQATGAPDTQRCGDYQTAWTAAGSDSVDWLDVRFPLAVHVTAVNVIQSFNPNQVVHVELVGAFGRSVAIYDGVPIQVDQACPYTLAIPVEKTAARFDTVRISMDQSVRGLGWNEIDAVELVGEAE